MLFSPDSADSGVLLLEGSGKLVSSGSGMLHSEASGMLLHVNIEPRSAYAARDCHPIAGGVFPLSWVRDGLSNVRGGQRDQGIEGLRDEGAEPGRAAPESANNLALAQYPTSAVPAQPFRPPTATHQRGRPVSRLTGGQRLITSWYTDAG